MTDLGMESVVEDVFTDTCVLFAYAVEGEADAQKIFDDHSLDKVTSERIEREFDAVADRHQDIHQELLEFAVSDSLEEYEPADLSQKNDVRYVVDLYSELTDVEDVEAVRRLNELVNQLEKARDELFESEGVVTVLSIDGIDAQLMGLLRGVVENDADARVLCDAVAWKRDDGSGVFLTEDTEDILGKDSSTGDANQDDRTSDAGELSDSFSDFLGSEERSTPEQINDYIASRYGRDSRLEILSTADFVEREYMTEDPPSRSR